MFFGCLFGLICGKRILGTTIGVLVGFDGFFKRFLVRITYDWCLKLVFVVIHDGVWGFCSTLLSTTV